MKILVKFLILIVFASFSSMRTMEKDANELEESPFNKIIQIKYHLENVTNPNTKNILDQDLTEIIEQLFILLEELAKRNINILQLLPQEFPSLSISYKAKLDKKSTGLKYHQKIFYINGYQSSEAETDQLNEFTSNLNIIARNAQKKFESLALPYAPNLKKKCFIKMKVGLHFKKQENDLNAEGIISEICTYISKIYNVYRW